MLKTRLILIVLILFCTSAYGADSKPSVDSIKNLLRATNSQRLHDNMMMEFDTIMDSLMQQTLKDQDITPKQQKQLDELKIKMISAFKDELKWETLEPLYIKIYRDSFTPQEIDGMVAFYETAAGQAVLNKMPQVIQSTMAEMQNRMGPFMVKLIKTKEEAIEKMKADTAQK